MDLVCISDSFQRRIFDERHTCFRHGLNGRKVRKRKELKSQVIEDFASFAQLALITGREQEFAPYQRVFSGRNVVKSEPNRPKDDRDDHSSPLPFINAALTAYGNACEAL
jgi:hypothetical protein